MGVVVICSPDLYVEILFCHVTVLGAFTMRVEPSEMGLVPL